MTDSVFSWPIRVYFEDTDASGVVYHANYLRWFERARTEWLRAQGYDQQKLMDELGIAFTVATIAIAYKRPARLDDQVEVLTHIAEQGKVTLTLAQKLVPAGNHSEIMTTAQVGVVCVDSKNFRPKRFPDFSL
jgi:acyl-CoA thioester hydrolase